MSKIKVFFVIVLFLMIPLYALAVNTITYLGGTSTITISAIDSDWTWTDTFPTKTEGIKIWSIRFNPGAASDRCVINAGSVSGGHLFDSSVAGGTGDGTIQYYDPTKRVKPVLDISDGGGAPDGNAKITIELAE